MQKKNSLDYDLIILGSGPAVAAAKSFAENNNKKLAVFPRATFVSPYEISLDSSGKKLLSSKFFLLALSALPNVSGISGANLALTSSQALRLKSPPASAVVVGAGPTGCTLAAHLASLGSSVTLLESAARILPREDEELSLALKKYFRSLGVQILTQSRATNVSKTALDFLRGGRKKSLSTDLIILATGSHPDTNLGLDHAGVAFTASGIIVDDFLRTSAHHIYAVGDTLDGEHSPERATYEGALAAANLFSRQKNLRNYDGFIRFVPLASATSVPNTPIPEANTVSVSIVGLTEDACVRHGLKYDKILFPAPSLSPAVLSSAAARFSFIKLLSDEKQKLLGAAVVAPHSELLVQELALAVRHKLPLTTLASTPHLSSSPSELVHQAARAFLKQLKK